MGCGERSARQVKEKRPGSISAQVYSRTGTLWDGRDKSSLVQAETDLILCPRYIELDPVRAGMVADPAQDRWGSYRANALGASD